MADPLLFPGTKQGWRPSPTCPKGHRLDGKTVAGSWFGSAKTCARCNAQLNSGQQRHSCKACNHHLCSACHNLRADEMLREEITITIYRAAQPGLLPGMGVEEDTFQVSIVAGASVDDLKARVQDLYGLPRVFQTLRRDVDSAPLGGGEPVACDSEDVLYLGGAGAAGPLAGLFGGGAAGLLGGAGGAGPLDGLFGGGGANGAGGLEAMLASAMEQAAQMGQAWQENLQSIELKIRCVMPARGRLPEKRCELTVSAVARVAEVLEMAVLELSAEGQELGLEFAGEPLPAVAQVHMLGLRDGDTVLVVPPRVAAASSP